MTPTRYAKVTVGALPTSGGSGPVTYKFNPADGSFTAGTKANQGHSHRKLFFVYFDLYAVSFLSPLPWGGPLPCDPKFFFPDL